MEHLVYRVGHYIGFGVFSIYLYVDRSSVTRYIFSKKKKMLYTGWLKKVVNQTYIFFMFHYRVINNDLFKYTNDF